MSIVSLRDDLVAGTQFIFRVPVSRVSEIYGGKNFNCRYSLLFTRYLKCLYYLTPTMGDDSTSDNAAFGN
ncbi:hypothetical protein [Pleurocapsa sp. PCC 7319]|uniref:hypothetical protein n=1 Tax=Pleurocapsa sp. PCC 7319 TaxID=118161 RepID=UPI001181A271|nr:hypothetical protein [Pleurocapsa sp. PCC 7319]